MCGILVKHQYHYCFNYKPRVSASASFYCILSVEYFVVHSRLPGSKLVCFKTRSFNKLKANELGKDGHFVNHRVVRVRVLDWTAIFVASSSPHIYIFCLNALPHLPPGSNLLLLSSYVFASLKKARFTKIHAFPGIFSHAKCGQPKIIVNLSNFPEGRCIIEYWPTLNIAFYYWAPGVTKTKTLES